MSMNLMHEPFAYAALVRGDKIVAGMNRIKVPVRDITISDDVPISLTSKARITFDGCKPMIRELGLGADVQTVCQEIQAFYWAFREVPEKDKPKPTERTKRVFEI